MENRPRPSTSRTSSRHPLLQVRETKRPGANIRLDVRDKHGYYLCIPEARDEDVVLPLLDARLSSPRTSSMGLDELMMELQENERKTDFRYWLQHFQTHVLPLIHLPSASSRNKALFDDSKDVPIKTSVPYQVVRHRGIAVGQCILTPRLSKPPSGSTKKAHPTLHRPYCHLSVWLHGEHRGKGVLFAACRELLNLAVQEYEVRLIYASAISGNEDSTTRLLRRLQDWSSQRWSGRFEEGDKASLKLHYEEFSHEEQEATQARHWVYWWLWEIGSKGEGDLLGGNEGKSAIGDVKIEKGIEVWRNAQEEHKRALREVEERRETYRRKLEGKRMLGSVEPVAEVERFIDGGGDRIEFVEAETVGREVREFLE